MIEYNPKNIRYAPFCTNKSYYLFTLCFYVWIYIQGMLSTLNTALISTF